MVVAYCVLALFAKAARTQRNMAGVLVLVLAVFTVTSFGNIFSAGEVYVRASQCFACGEHYVECFLSVFL